MKERSDAADATTRSGSILLSVSSLERCATPSSVGHGQGQGEGQSERRSRSSRATSVMSFLGVERQDMMDLFDDQHTTGVCLCSPTTLVPISCGFIVRQAVGFCEMLRTSCTAVRFVVDLLWTCWRHRFVAQHLDVVHLL